MADWGAMLQGFLQTGGGRALGTGLGEGLQKRFDPKSYYKGRGYKVGSPAKDIKDSQFFDIQTKTDDQGNQYYKTQINKRPQLLKLQMLANEKQRDEIDTENYEDKVEGQLTWQDLRNEAKEQNINQSEKIFPLKKRGMELDNEQSAFNLNYAKDRKPLEIEKLKEAVEQAGITTDQKAFNLETDKMKRPLTIDLLENQLTNSEIQTEINEATKDNKIKQSDLKTKQMELENDFLNDTYDLRVQKVKQEVEKGNLDIETAEKQIKKIEQDIEKQDMFLNEYEEMLDNRVKSGELDNAEKKLKLAQLQKQMKKSGSSQGIINYYVNNPKEFGLAVNRDIVSKETINKVNQKLGGNVFKQPTQSNNFSESVAYDMYVDEWYNKNEFSGEPTSKKKNAPSFQEYYAKLNSNNFEGLTSSSNQGGGTTTGGGQQTGGGQTDKEGGQKDSGKQTTDAVTEIANEYDLTEEDVKLMREDPKDMVIGYFVNQENVSEEKAEKVYNKLMDSAQKQTSDQGQEETQTTTQGANYDGSWDTQNLNINGLINTSQNNESPRDFSVLKNDQVSEDNINGLDLIKAVTTMERFNNPDKWQSTNIFGNNPSVSEADTMNLWEFIQHLRSQANPQTMFGDKSQGSGNTVY